MTVEESRGSIVARDLAMHLDVVMDPRGGDLLVAMGLGLVVVSQANSAAGHAPSF